MSDVEDENSLLGVLTDIDRLDDTTEVFPLNKVWSSVPDLTGSRDENINNLCVWLRVKETNLGCW